MSVNGYHVLMHIGPMSLAHDNTNIIMVILVHACTVCIHTPSYTYIHTYLSLIGNPEVATVDLCTLPTLIEHIYTFIIHLPLCKLCPLVQGFVSDGNSYALGGISGHAGLLCCSLVCLDTVSVFHYHCHMICTRVEISSQSQQVCSVVSKASLFYCIDFCLLFLVTRGLTALPSPRSLQSDTHSFVYTCLHTRPVKCVHISCMFSDCTVNWLCG